MFARIGRLVRGFMSLFVSGLEKRTPKPSWRRRATISAPNGAVQHRAGAHGGHRRAPEGPGQDEGRPRAGARTPDPGQPRAGNLELAGTLARELQELKADLTTDTEELKETEEAYQANMRQAKVVQREFEDKVRRLEKQLSQVQVKEAQAEAASALSNTAFKVGDLGDTLKDVEGILRSATRSRPARPASPRTWSTWTPSRKGKRAQGARAERARRVPRQPGHSGDPPAQAGGTPEKEIGPS